MTKIRISRPLRASVHTSLPLFFFPTAIEMKIQDILCVTIITVAPTTTKCRSIYSHTAGPCRIANAKKKKHNSRRSRSLLLGLRPATAEVTVHSYRCHTSGHRNIPDVCARSDWVLNGIRMDFGGRNIRYPSLTPFYDLMFWIWVIRTKRTVLWGGIPCCRARK